MNSVLIDPKSYNEFVLIEFRSIFFILLQFLPLTGYPFFENHIHYEWQQL